MLSVNLVGWYGICMICAIVYVRRACMLSLCMRVCKKKAMVNYIAINWCPVHYINKSKINHYKVSLDIYERMDSLYVCHCCFLLVCVLCITPMQSIGIANYIIHINFNKMWQHIFISNFLSILRMEWNLTIFLSWLFSFFKCWLMWEGHMAKMSIEFIII